MNSSQGQAVKEFKQKIMTLPPLPQVKPIHPKTIIFKKTEEDPQHYYKYKYLLESIDRVSDDSEISKNIREYIQKLNIQELSITEKYMLDNYISIYIKETHKKISTKKQLMTQKTINRQWELMKNLWELQKIKWKECQVRVVEPEETDQIQNKFVQLKKAIEKASMNKKVTDYGVIHKYIVGFLELLFS